MCYEPEDVMDCRIEDLPDDYIHRQLRNRPWLLELKDELQRRDDNKERMSDEICNTN